MIWPTLKVVVTYIIAKLVKPIYNLTMAKIHVYDTTPLDRSQLTHSLNQHQLIFSDRPVNEAEPDPQSEIISVFVSSVVSAELIVSLPQLKLIACRSTGVNNIDLNAAKAKGITVVSVPTYGENTVAEYTLGLLLSLSRRLPEAAAAFNRSDTSHDALMGIDIFGKTIGIIGTGRIGRNVGTIARAFGMNIVAYDVFENPEWAAGVGAEYADLVTVLKRSDIVTLHTPLMKETYHLLGEEQFALMKPGALLVNTARGALVDTEALIEALKSGKLKGAALDVFEAESLLSIDEEVKILRDSKENREALKDSLSISLLQKLDNVIITNHNAYNTVEAIGRINQTTADNISAYINGNPQNQVKV